MLVIHIFRRFLGLRGSKVLKLVRGRCRIQTNTQGLKSLDIFHLPHDLVGLKAQGGKHNSDPRVPRLP